jgi:hypothetical protein
MKRTASTGRVASWRIACATGIASLLMSVACPTVDSHALFGKQPHLFPELGWREPVSMKESAWNVDRLLGGKPSNAYNCHYYTKSFIERRDLDTVPFRALVPDGLEDISSVYLQGWGYELRAGAKAQVGDIVVAEKPSPFDHGQRIFTHSAIVAEINDRGQIARLRQKFDPRHPVVDLTLDDFQRIYVGESPRSYSVWGKSSQSYAASVSL